MNKFDIINASFEAFGAYTAWANFFRLRRDLEIKGVYWPIWAFFSVWGMWNLIFYPAVGAWFSFAAGVVLCAGNIAWTVQAAILHFDGDFDGSNAPILGGGLIPTRGEEGTGPYIHEDEERTTVWLRDEDVVEVKS